MCVLGIFVLFSWGCSEEQYWQIGNIEINPWPFFLNLRVPDTSIGTSQVALVVKNPPANSGDIRDVDSIPGSGRSPGGGHGNPLQCSCLEDPMAREAWWTAVYEVAKSQTRIKRLSSSNSNIRLIKHTQYTVEWQSWNVTSATQLWNPTMVW